MTSLPRRKRRSYYTVAARFPAVNDGAIIDRTSANANCAGRRGIWVGTPKKLNNRT